MFILIAGPYRSGTNDDPEKIAANVHLMEAFALPIFRMGHIPVLVNGLRFRWFIWQAQKKLAMSRSMKSFIPSQNGFWKNVMRFCRVGGASQGADLMVEVARKRGLQIYFTLDEIPTAK